MKMQKGKRKNLIEAKGLVHEYARRDENGDVMDIIRAVDGVDLQIKEGSFAAILGANGSGKSTFAKHLNALLFPTEGALYIGGMNTADKEKTLQIRQMAGMVFQNPDNQIIANVVEEDVAFGMENIGVPADEILKRVEQSLKEVGMEQYRKHSPNHLSGGQKQRVAIAGIMAMRPKCIILDEATAMLDPVGRKNVLDTIQRLNQKEHITILLITHYMEEAAQADFVYVMKQGKAVCSGTPREVFQKTELLRECRLEAPQITQIAQGLHRAGVPVRQDILTSDELAEQLLQLVRKR
jgi:energy-coupling factor transporter ATPase